MPDGTGSRFKKVADELFGGNVSEFARNMQMTPGAFAKYVKGDTMPGGEILKRLIQLDINPAWILVGIPPMRVSQITEADVLSFTLDDAERYKEKGIENIAKEAPKSLNLSKLTPEVYNSPIKMMHYMIEDFSKAWENEGQYLPAKKQKEVLNTMLDIIIQQATNAKNRID